MPTTAVAVCVDTRVCVVVGRTIVDDGVSVSVALFPPPAASRGWAFEVDLVCVAVWATCAPLPAGNAVGSTTVGVQLDTGVTVAVACRRMGKGELVGEDCPKWVIPSDCG